MKYLNRHNFYLEQLAVKNAEKKKKLYESRLIEFQSIITEGRKSDFVTIYLKSNEKVNENYSLILEDQEVLFDTKKVICSNFYKDRIKDIALETRNYLQSKNIPLSDIELIEENIEIILINEGFLDWIGRKVDKGIDVVKKGVSNVWNYLSDKAKETWNSIIDDIFKPGIEALRNVAVKLFGEDIVKSIETTAKYTLDKIDDFITKSKSVFDKVYSSLKDIAKKIVNIVNDMWDKIKEMLGKIWDIIKKHAINILPGIKSKLSKLKKLGDKVNPSNLEEEVSMLSEDIQEFSNKNYFFNIPLTGFTKIATSSLSSLADTGDSGVVNDSFIWDSLKGFISKDKSFNTSELLRLNEAGPNDENAMMKKSSDVEEEGHKAESRGIKKWISGLVLWILSPIGKLVEIVTDVVTKGLCALPAWLSGKLGKLYEGASGLVKYAKKFVAIGTLTSFIVGIAYESYALGSKISGGIEAIKGTHGSEHSDDEDSHEGEGSVTNISKLNPANKDVTLQGKEVEVDGITGATSNENKLYDFKSFSKINESNTSKGLDWKSLSITAGSALLGFLVSTMTHSVPFLHFGFECISLCILVMGGLGYLLTETEWGKKISQKFPKISKVGKSVYSFAHGH